MLRFLLKMMFMVWFFAVLTLLFSLGIGKTAPESSKIAFFSQEIDGTDYWRLDLFTGVAFKDHYYPRILVNSIDSLAFNPVDHFLQIEAIGEEYAIYEINLRTQERRYIDDYPTSNHYIVLEGDFVFIVDFIGGSYDWTKIDIPSGESAPFLENTTLESLALSPDESWLAGIGRHEHLVINMLNGSQYTLSGYCCILWSPDSQWYIAAHDNSAGIISVLSANGTFHPLLPESFAAPGSRWSADSQSIYFEQDEHLASISLQTGEIREYAPTAQSFHSDCIAPNEAYILVYNELKLALINIETGVQLWRDENYSERPACFWSEDSRYLAMHVSAREIDAMGMVSVYWQRFIFIDTLNGTSWGLYPEALPIMPIYIHIPE